MTHRTREEVFADVVRLLKSIDRNSADSEITENMYLFGDLTWQSIQMIVLATEIQKLYKQRLPFDEFLEAAGARGKKDITVGEWVDFVYAQLRSKPVPAAGRV